MWADLFVVMFFFQNVFFVVLFCVVFGCFVRELLFISGFLFACGIVSPLFGGFLKLQDLYSDAHHIDGYSLFKSFFKQSFVMFEFVLGLDANFRSFFNMGFGVFLGSRAFRVDFIFLV